MQVKKNINKDQNIFFVTTGRKALTLQETVQNLKKKI